MACSFSDLRRISDANSISLTCHCARGQESVRSRGDRLAMLWRHQLTFDVIKWRMSCYNQCRCECLTFSDRSVTSLKWCVDLPLWRHRISFVFCVRLSFCKQFKFEFITPCLQTPLNTSVCVCLGVISKVFGALEEEEALPGLESAQWLVLGRGSTASRFR